MAKKPAKLRVIPLGGMQEIGKNMTAIEYKNEILVIDCGLGFPEDEMLGIDIVIPDITFLVKNAANVKGIVITHGHEDHIGAIPYVLKKINIPIYGSKLTLGLIANKLKEHRIHDAQLHEVEIGTNVKVGNFGVDFIRVNHSIPDACALAIHTGMGVIFHSGDFKIDYTPIDGKVMDFHKIAELGKSGVALLLCESTNVEKEGFSISEKVVGKTFDNLFSGITKNRILVATFSSNVHRVQQIVDSAAKYNRKVVISGRSMLNTIGIAQSLGYINIPAGTLIDINDMNKYGDHELLILTTGSQGEPMAALSRIAAKEHKKIVIKKGDVVIMSAHPIPGNEKGVSKVINQLFENGAEVIYEGLSEIHVSGHACKEELKLLHRLVKPKYFMPVHGEYRHLEQHARLAMELGMDEENIFRLNNGQVLELDKKVCAIAGRVPSGNILVDGLGVGDVGNIVLRDRKHLSEDGLIVVVVTMSREDGMVASGPDIISRGFVYVREAEDIIDESKVIVKKCLKRCEEKNIREWSYMKNMIREDLKKYLYEKTKRNPMILPIIMEV
ncbi:MAG: ribonuclease J [Proteocatella sp.]